MARGSRGLKGKQRRKRIATAKGFTLLEVMIALTIFATLAAAVISANHYALRQSARVKEQMQGAWLADNQLSELRLQAVSPGRQQVLRQFGQRDWLVEQTITAGDDPRILKVDISVKRPDSDQPIYRTSSWMPAANE